MVSPAMASGSGVNWTAVSEFQGARQILQDVYWQSLRQKRGPPTPVQSGLTTPQEERQAPEMEVDTEGPAASSDPSLLQPSQKRDTT